MHYADEFQSLQPSSGIVVGKQTNVLFDYNELMSIDMASAWVNFLS